MCASRAIHRYVRNVLVRSGIPDLAVKCQQILSFNFGNKCFKVTYEYPDCWPASYWAVMFVRGIELIVLEVIPDTFTQPSKIDGHSTSIVFAMATCNLFWLSNTSQHCSNITGPPGMLKTRKGRAEKEKWQDSRSGTEVRQKAFP